MAKITTSTKVKARYTPPVLAPGITLQGAAAIQTYDSLESGEACYTPNRKLQPTYIVPTVSATSDDNTIDVSDATPTATTWYINGQPIEECGWAAADYEIITSDKDGLTKGTLIIRRNIAPGEVYEAVALITYTDLRGKGANNRIWSDPVRLRTNTRTLSAMVCRTDMPTSFAYNPALDPLDEYEYSLIAEGKTSDTATLNSLKAHPRAYLRRYEVRMMAGPLRIDPSLYTVHVEAVTGKTLREVTPETDGAIISITSEAVTVDARYVADTTRYRITATLKADTIKSKSFDIEIRRITPTLTYEMVNTTQLDHAASIRTEELAVFCGNRRLPHPERIVDISWRAALDLEGTDTPVYKSVGTGAKISASMTELGVKAALSAGKRLTGLLWDIDCELKAAPKKTTI